MNQLVEILSTNLPTTTLLFQKTFGSKSHPNSVLLLITRALLNLDMSGSNKYIWVETRLSNWTGKLNHN